MIETLLENHRAFLRFLERRVGDRQLAEDILQDAFAKVVDHPELAPTDEGIVPWFYRTLRNAATDQFRRRGAADRALAAFARELETSATPSADLNAEICACVSPVTAFTSTQGISPGNAGVRIFRARQALKKRVAESCGACAEHGCLDCSCRAHQP